MTGGGSGGSILLIAETLIGTTGIVRAKGGDGGWSSIYAEYAGGGAGGRIAVHIDPQAQGQEVKPEIRFSVAPGKTALPRHPRKQWWLADWGTIHFTDYNVVIGDLRSNKVNGYLHASELTEITFDSLILGPEMVLGFDQPVSITVDGDVDISADAALITRHPLQFEGDGSFTSRGTVHLADDTVMEIGADLVVTGPGGRTFINRPDISVGGNLVVSDGADMRVFAAATNGLPDEIGGSLEIAGDMSIESGGRLHPYAQVWDGGELRFSARTLTVESGSAIDADWKGFAHRSGPGRSATGASTSIAGAGYGGEGGISESGRAGGSIYGNRLFPSFPGSGSGDSNRAYGGSGGGVIWLDIDGRIRLDGDLTAMGQNGQGHASRAGGGGSGGSILLFCERLTGTGTMNAGGGNGGSVDVGGGGGGGRVAIWYGLNRADRQALLENPIEDRIMETVAVATFEGDVPSVAGGSGHEAGDDGTVALFRLLSPPGTIILLR